MPTHRTLTKLLTWLRKRGEPDSGIRYEGPSAVWDYEDGVRVTRRQARVELHGTDADFIAEHFHGAGARAMADAIEELLALNTGGTAK